MQLNGITLTRDELSTSSHANIQVTQFNKTHAIYTVLKNTETLVVSFDHVEATGSCAVVLTPLSWLWF